MKARLHLYAGVDLRRGSNLPPCHVAAEGEIPLSLGLNGTPDEPEPEGDEGEASSLRGGRFEARLKSTPAWQQRESTIEPRLNGTPDEPKHEGDEGEASSLRGGRFEARLKSTPVPRSSRGIVPLSLASMVPPMSRSLKEMKARLHLYAGVDLRRGSNLPPRSSRGESTIEPRLNGTPNVEPEPRLRLPP